jgi:hypothetical protein
VSPQEYAIGVFLFGLVLIAGCLVIVRRYWR